VTTYQIRVPYPPSKNEIHAVVPRYAGNRVVGGRLVVTAKASNYKKRLAHQLAKLIDEPFDADVKVTMRVWFPRLKRRRDVHNSIELLMDALTDGGLWSDDSQVREMAVSIAGATENGAVELFIEPIERLLF